MLANACLRPILLTDSVEKSEIIQALLWGARGVVRKESPSHMLFKSIRAVMAGQYWISHEGICELVQNIRWISAFNSL
jgi:DNA-binding NarL/FixJ family response regulator